MQQRKRIRTSEQARKVAKKLGVSRKKVFRGKTKGEIIYKNPDAVPVDPIIRKRGERIPFKLENVEQLRLTDRIATSMRGIIHKGKVKFKGKAASQKVVVKELIKPPFKGALHAEEAIKRLEASNVVHPKMAYLKHGGRRYVIMEPFVRSKEGKIVSKFESVGDTIMPLDLRKETDKEIFRQAVIQAAELAKAGMALGKAYSEMFFRADVFNVITLKNGQKKVLVQDLDTLCPGRDVESSWWTSANVLLTVVSQFKKANPKIAEKIILEVGRELGFSATT